MTFGLVAGEVSGDLLGAGLIRALRQRYPDARFVGIGGAEMQAEGFHSLVPMERLSVMGLVEVLGRLRELFAIRRRILDYFLINPPAVFIGIDAPDFTLGLESQLHQAGIATVHYVSPSVWAWRRGRLRKIARAVDLMLCLFPFEVAFYQAQKIPVTFVGHPLAHRIPLQVDVAKARRGLGLLEDGLYVALLPGSRGGEVALLGEVFLRAAHWLVRRLPQVRFVIACANPARARQIEQMLAAFPVALPVTCVLGHSREVMAASDAVLLASGTATLEAMLLKRPMVVAYKLKPITYFILRKMVRIDTYALPNLLAGEALVPELIQSAATPEALGEALLQHLSNPSHAATLQARFSAIHEALRCDADQLAAAAISRLLLSGKAAPL